MSNRLMIIIFWLLSVFSSKLWAQWEWNGLDSMIIENYDTSRHQFVSAWWIKFGRDANCNVSFYVNQSSDDTIRALLTYDNQNRLSNIKFQKLKNNVYKDSTQTHVTYNSNSTQIHTETEQLWVAGTWVNSRLTQYTYSSGQTDRTKKIWSNSTWINEVRIIQNFNSQNLLTTELSEKWDTSHWTNQLRIFNTYNIQKLPTLHLTEYWNVSSAQWIPYSQIVTTYTAQNQRFVEKTQSWSPNQWFTSVVDSLISATTDGRLLTYEVKVSGQLVWKLEYNYSSRNLLEMVTYYVPTPQQPNIATQLSSRFRMVYNPACLPTSTEPIRESSRGIVIAPNPVPAILNVDLNTVQSKPTEVRIHNAAGQLIEILPCDGSLHFQYSIEHLPNGLYLLAIRGDSWQSVQKFVVQH